MKTNTGISGETVKERKLSCTEDGELMTGGCSTVQLSQIYGTPVHIVDEEGLRAGAASFLDTIRSKYPGKISVHYAFKCNPVPGIIKIIKECGIKAEVMSGFELMLALMM